MQPGVAGASIREDPGAAHRRGVLHMDETRIQCNKEEGKKAHSQSFMCVVRSAASEDIQATFFYYDRGRNGEVAAELLKGFHGYLVTDAYEGYGKVEGVKRSLCWTHVRRYLIDSIPLTSNLCEGQRGALHTGGERKGQRSGCAWVSKVLIDGDAKQPSSRTPGGH